MRDDRKHDHAWWSLAAGGRRRRRPGSRSVAGPPAVPADAADVAPG